jgi:hypothetical protein
MTRPWSAGTCRRPSLSCSCCSAAVLSRSRRWPSWAVLPGPGSTRSTFVHGFKFVLVQIFCTSGNPHTVRSHWSRGKEQKAGRGGSRVGRGGARALLAAALRPGRRALRRRVPSPAAPRLRGLAAPGGCTSARRCCCRSCRCCCCRRLGARSDRGRAAGAEAPRVG